MKKVIFLSAFIDLNSAPFNRFNTIVKMVRDAKFDASIIFIHPLSVDKLSIEIERRGNELVYENEIYKNAVVYSKSENILRKIYLKLKVYQKAIKYISMEREYGHTILYLYSVSLIDYIFFYMVAKWLKLKYITERSEYPLLIRTPSKYKTFLYKYLVLPWCYKLFDGMVIMTQPLISFYERFIGGKAKVVKIPMTVDPTRFSDLPVTEDLKYLGYVGGLDRKKDGLDILIKGFSKIVKKFPDYSLKIAGNSNLLLEKKFLMDLVAELGLESKVQFMGSLRRDEIPEFLSSATILILSRPDSKQAEGGFPTKLGEYLMTGNPVIVTDVGEISCYLKNGKDAFIIKPDDVDELSEKIAYILEHPEISLKVGRQGQVTARKYFDYKNYINLIKGFIDSLF